MLESLFTEVAGRDSKTDVSYCKIVKNTYFEKAYVNGCF